MDSPGLLRAWMRALSVTFVVAGVVALGFDAAAYATVPTATWRGASELSPEWTEGPNWSTGLPPNPTEELATLSFPHLSQETCASKTPAEFCYLSDNDETGVATEALQLDDGDPYLIFGNAITLGSGGLEATPASGTTGRDGDVMELPIQLSAPQKWSVTDRSSGALGENGVLWAGAITGEASDGLTIELANGPLTLLAENDTEVGPVAIDGAQATQVTSNGVLEMGNAQLNSTDAEPVALSHVFLAGFNSTFGPLSTTDAYLDVENIEVDSAKLDGASVVGFDASGNGTTPRVDYSQLTSHGAIELNGAHFELLVLPPTVGARCPTLHTGETFTFVSTTGALSGQFSNAPEGSEVPIAFSSECSPRSQTIQLAYHDSGATQTVTGTVEGTRAGEEEASRRHREEEAASRRHREEEEAAANRRRQEEANVHGSGGAPGGGVLSLTQATVSAAQISASLGHGLKPTGKGAKIAALLKAGGFTFAFHALEAGSLVINWYATPSGGKLAKKSKPVLLASGIAAFGAAGTAEIRIKLTSAGKHLLKRSKHLKLTAHGTFTPPGGQGISASRTFVLTR